MAYYSRIYVIEKQALPAIDFPKGYAQVVASVEMKGTPALRALFKKETDSYIYADDGSTQLLKDEYHEPLKEASIQEVIECLERAEAEEHYRRNVVLLGLLKAIDPKEWCNMAVLHYGC